MNSPVRSAFCWVACRGLQTKQNRFSQPSGIAMCFGARSALPSSSRVPTMTSGITMKNWLQIGELVGIGIGCAASSAGIYLESTPAIAFRPRSIPRQKLPPWNGSPRLKRHGTDRPSIFFPARHAFDDPTR